MRTDRRNLKNRKKLRSRLCSAIDIYDIVIIILIFAFSFLFLRYIPIFAITQSACAEMMIYFGAGPDNIPIFKHMMTIIWLMAGYWMSVTVLRITKGVKAYSVVIWHSLIFVCIFMLGYAVHILIPSELPPRPDGVLTVAYGDWKTVDDKRVWIPRPVEKSIKNENEKWYTDGRQHCIWLEDNKVTVLSDRSQYRARDDFDIFDLHIDLLLELQSYRPLTADERARFIQQQVCQNDMTLYAKKSSHCYYRNQYEVSEPQGLRYGETFWYEGMYGKTVNKVN